MTALRYEAELGLALAAAEVGLRPAELHRALGENPDIGRPLGPLRVNGGTVQRQAFLASYPELARILK